MGNIIQVENLSKKYIIGHQQLRGKKTFREAISQSFINLGSKFTHPFSKNISSNSPYEEFWALKNICFEVEQGDRIGIIGRNGAGKSTLLKVLSRITEPTSGKITIRGRVASLLEVGTGFNGELTGRENIFLNGAILGMHRAEIKQKFDEIVDFSGVEKFLDTPVKRYSSGMYVRLAFAVAAYLEPEILIVDEVLAVGDAEFQKKCLGKMQDVSQKGGRTVIFVSHNMSAIAGLCNTVALLNKGIIEKIGIPHEIISDYIHQSRENIQNLDLTFRTDFIGNGQLKVGQVLINGQNEYRIFNNQEIQITFEIINTRIMKGYMEFSGGIISDDNIYLCYFSSKLNNKQYYISEEKTRIHLQLPRMPFVKGNYYFSLEIKFNNEIIYVLNDAFIIKINDGNFYGTGVYWDGGGKFLIEQNWY